MAVDVGGLTEGALSARVGGVRLTDGAALALGDHHLLTVAQLVTLDLIAQHLTVVTHADPARFRLPDVPVGVDLTVRRAAALVACSGDQVRGRVSELRSGLPLLCDFFLLVLLPNTAVLR